MNIGVVEFDKIRFRNGVEILTGPKGTRALIAAEFPNAVVGTIYIATTGEVFQKVAHNTAAGVGQATDWQRSTFAASDS